MDFTLLSSFFTALSMAVFVGIVFWAYNKHNKARFEELGRTLLDNENGKD